MTGAEVAKSLFLVAIILTVIAAGLMLIPENARFLRAMYCFAAAGALIGYLAIAKPKGEWVGSNLRWLSGGLAIIGAIVAFGGAD